MEMNKVLFTAFNGKVNSSKILLDKIKTQNKLYLKNSFETSVKQFINEINAIDYDFIISFGQAPLEKDTIKIEIMANGEDSYTTKFDYSRLQKIFELSKFNVIISNNAGNYLCNNIYYAGLKYIDENKLKIKMIFIHIPTIKNISNINELAMILNKESDICVK